MLMRRLMYANQQKKNTIINKTNKPVYLLHMTSELCQDASTTYQVVPLSQRPSSTNSFIHFRIDNIPKTNLID